ncbi:MAG: ATP-binding cassette domain-containing protein [Dehalococcoidia bacterium]
MADIPPYGGVVLELTDLTKRYEDVVALDGASFEVPSGRMVGFLGPNGAGKTTAMRSVFGLVRLDGGEIRWDGRPVGPDETRRFGYMPEARGLYPKMAVGEQVEYFARLHGAEASAARRYADHWIERLDLGDRRESRVETLSHGNQQRVQLAVSLAFPSDLLILDEPFSGLDPIAVTTMGDVIREEAQRGAGVLFSSHQLDLVEDLCDDVVIVNRGRVVLQGTLDSVREASPFRYVAVSGPAGVTATSVSAWWRQIPAAELTEQREGRLRLRVAASADPASMLAAARERGEVTGFRFEPPSLSDLFLEAVGR